MKASEQESTLRRYVGALESALGPALVAAALFGSRARGDARAESDWDLLVLVRDEPQDTLALVARLQRVCGELAGATPAIMLRSTARFERDFPAVYLDIAEDARVLAGSDYLGPRLRRIREIAGAAGLRRARDDTGLHWEWDRSPRGHWGIDWDGYRDLA